MVKKFLKKARKYASKCFAFLAVLSVVGVSMLIPASASIEDGDRTTVLTAYGMFDTIEIESFGMSQLPFLPYQMALNNANNTYSYIEFGTATQPEGYDQLVFDDPYVYDTYPTEARLAFSPPQNNSSTFYLTASRGFVIDLDNWENYYAWLQLPPNCSAYIEHDIICFVPVELLDGTVEYQRIVGSFHRQWANESDEVLWVPLTTVKTDFFGSYADKAVGLGYCTVHSLYVEADEYDLQQLGQWSIRQRYADINNMPNTITLLERYPIIRNQQVGDIDLTGFLAGALGGFWNFELMPNVTFGGIVMMVIGVLTLFAILHLLR